MKQSEKRGKNNKIGAIGEDLATRFLMERGHTIVDRNYLKKWGEIDIVSRETKENKEIVHFVEVKTVSYETIVNLEQAVSYGTWRPEENVHHEKIRRLSRVIESWLLEKKITSDWQIDVVSVRIVPRDKYSTIKYLPNITLT
jgi:putative endonuclease